MSQTTSSASRHSSRASDRFSISWHSEPKALGNTFFMLVEGKVQLVVLAKFFVRGIPYCRCSKYVS